LHAQPFLKVHRGGGLAITDDAGQITPRAQSVTRPLFDARRAEAKQFHTTSSITTNPKRESRIRAKAMPHLSGSALHLADDGFPQRIVTGYASHSIMPLFWKPFPETVFRIARSIFDVNAADVPHFGIPSSRLGARPLSIQAGRISSPPFEGPAKVRCIGESNAFSDLIDRQSCVLEKFDGE
jgi:hypothetical protein